MRRAQGRSAELLALDGYHDTEVTRLWFAVESYPLSVASRETSRSIETTTNYCTTFERAFTKRVAVVVGLFGAIVAFQKRELDFFRTPGRGNCDQDLRIAPVLFALLTKRRIIPVSFVSIFIKSFQPREIENGRFAAGKKKPKLPDDV